MLKNIIYQKIILNNYKRYTHFCKLTLLAVYNNRSTRKNMETRTQRDPIFYFFLGVGMRFILPLLAVFFCGRAEGNNETSLILRALSQKSEQIISSCGPHLLYLSFLLHPNFPGTFIKFLMEQHLFNREPSKKHPSQSDES